MNRAEELNNLIDLYEYLYNNHLFINNVFKDNSFNFDGLNKEIILKNFDNLKLLREHLINKNFIEAQELYSSIKLVGNQKNLIKPIIEYYNSNKNIDYDINSSIITNSKINSIDSSNLLLDNINVMKKDISDFKSIILEKIQDISLENYYNDIITQLLEIKNNISEIKINPEKPFSNLNEHIVNEQTIKFENAINNTINKVQLYEETSKAILNNTRDIIIESNTKMLPEVKKIIQQTFLDEVKEYFKNTLEIFKSSKKNLFLYVMSSIAMIIFTAGLSAFITVKILMK